MTKFKMDINTPFIKELIILVMGPLFQVFAYYLLINTIKDIDLIKMYHLGILSFNLLPIYPLDGGRIINLFINKKYYHISKYNSPLSLKNFENLMWPSVLMYSSFRILLPNNFWKP